MCKILAWIFAEVYQSDL